MQKKKIEKLNSKAGVDILDVYKTKHSSKFIGELPSQSRQRFFESKQRNVSAEEEKSIMIQKMNECEKENEDMCTVNDKTALIPKDPVVKPLEMKLSKKKKIVFV